MKRIKIKTLILHIGSHKTGTTYIQKYFKENKHIANQKKLLYPKSGCGSLYGHHEIYRAIKNKNDDLERIFESIRKEVLKSHESIFLSSENFEYLNVRDIEKLVDFFSVEQVRVIYLYRTWTPLLYAMWQEEIKHGATVSFESFCLHHVGFPMSSNLLNYSFTLDSFEKVIGRNNISVASYDILRNIDLIDFFCTLIGLECRADSIKGEKVNSSFDPFLVETIRVMNEFALREKFSRSYLPKHLYINKACAGKAGNSRDNRIRNAMSPYLTLKYDHNQSFAFKYVYGQFFEGYSSCFVDGVHDIKSILRLKYDVPKVVDSGYLLDKKVLSDLHSAWEDVCSGMSQ